MNILNWQLRLIHLHSNLVHLTLCREISDTYMVKEGTRPRCIHTYCGFSCRYMHPKSSVSLWRWTEFVKKEREGVLATSSIMGPSASLSMTPCPVDDTSDFCTSSMLAAAAFSATNKQGIQWRGCSKDRVTPKYFYRNDLQNLLWDWMWL